LLALGSPRNGPLGLRIHPLNLTPMGWKSAGSQCHNGLAKVRWYIVTPPSLAVPGVLSSNSEMKKLKNPSTTMMAVVDEWRKDKTLCS
jgi:hypothetical protein